MRAVLRFLALGALGLSAVPARAQMVLPGATNPGQVGTVVSPTVIAKPKPKVPRLPPAVAAPAETVLAGKTYFLNGGKSQIGFTARDKTVEITRLLFAGSKISNVRDTCQVDVQGMPLAVTGVGKDKGSNRFTVPLPVCPMAFDVLDGAILMSANAPTCTFTEADCTVSPNGIWGPAPGDIGADQVKLIERERTRAESEIRIAYKGIVSSTKDRAFIRSVASDQAGFSSRREEICRDYVGESRHGFCASRVSLARAAELKTAYASAAAEEDKRKKR